MIKQSLALVSEISRMIKVSVRIIWLSLASADNLDYSVYNKNFIQSSLFDEQRITSYFLCTGAL